MKVLVVNNMAPFVWGGAEELAVNLKLNLEKAGHEAEVLRIPFQWEPAAGIPSQMMLVRALELWNVDRVIALKFPAYLIRHPHKTFWLLHQYRQAYDLYDAAQTNIPQGVTGDELRQLIKRADDQAFTEGRRIFTNSEVTRERLRKYNGFDAQVLLPPINDPERFGHGRYGDYIFAGGRINDMKRQYLLLEALSLMPAHLKLVIAGPADTPSDGEKLRATVERLKLQDRVRLDIRFLPRDVYADYLNGARAVAYLPFDEDSLGYVAMEGAMARKALITTDDSGGVLGLVRHEQTGWVAQPNAASLAKVMALAGQNTDLCEIYGQRARSLWDGLGIDWPNTVRTLLS